MFFPNPNFIVPTARPSVRDNRAASTDYVRTTHPFVTPQMFGGTTVPDGSDETEFIQAAIDSFATVPENAFGRVWLPRGIYGISSPIVYPIDYPLVLEGDGFGDHFSAPTQISALNAMEAMVKTNDGVFLRGNQMRNLAFAGNKLVDYNVLWPSQGDHALIENITCLDALVNNFSLGNGSNEVQEILLRHIRISNDSATTFGGLPTYGLQVNCFDSHFFDLISTGAQTANFYLQGGNNDYAMLHAYKAFGNVSLNPPTYGYRVDDFGSRVLMWQCDGAATANMFVNSFNAQIGHGLSQFDGVTPSTHILMGDSREGNFVAFNQFFNGGTAISYGTPSGVGNFFAFNYDGNAGKFLVERRMAPVTVGDLPAASTAFKGAQATVSDSSVTTFNTIVAAGGGNTVPVTCDGTNWRVG